MSNPIYRILGGGMNNNLLSQFNQFRQTFRGNPKEQVQRLLNSGQMTPQQFNQLKQMAEQFRGLMK